MVNSFKNWWYAKWWLWTHPPSKPLKTLDMLNRSLGLLEQYLEGCQITKTLEIRMRYKDAIAHRKKKIEELGIRAPTSLEELKQLKSWILNNGSRYGE